METYHKIQTLWLRDPETKFRTLIEGAWATPEFEYLRNCQWSMTEKVDGTNIRVMWDGHTVTFGGKTDTAQIPATLINRLNILFDHERFAAAFDEGPVCLYGEGYGAGIQKGGGNYRSDQSFVLFDVRCGDWWLRRDDVYDVASKLGTEIPVVPRVGVTDLPGVVAFVRDGFNSRWGDFKAEGVVVRPMIELFTRSGARVIGKLKYKDFEPGTLGSQKKVDHATAAVAPVE